MQRSLFCFTWMGDRGHFREQRFQCQRRGDAGNHDQKDDRRKINRLDNADLKALLGHEVGDEVTINIPRGSVTYEITEIKFLGHKVVE